MNDLQRQELDKWIVEQTTALNDAEAALLRVHFAEQMIDRLLHESGVALEGKPERHLYVVQD